MKKGEELKTRNNKLISESKHPLLTLKGLGGHFDPPPTPSFSKTVSSKERVKPCFFVTCNIIISHIFLKILLKFFKLFRRYEDFLCQY